MRRICELTRDQQKFILEFFPLNPEDPISSAVECLKRKRESKAWHIEVLKGEIKTIDKVVKEISTTPEEKLKREKEYDAELRRHYGAFD